MEPWLTFVNFMTYDMHGPWEAQRSGAFIRPQTSIVDIKKVATPLWFSGLNPFKINLGMAYYGRGYTASNLDCVGLGCPYSGESLPGQCTNSRGIISLTEIKDLIRQKNLTPKLIPDDMIKQIAFGNQWIGYDDADTIALKSRWADQHCLGGTAIWIIDFNSGVVR
jgi:chitinase